LSSSQFFDKKGKVSVWVGVRKPDLKAMEGVDLLEDLCGVDSYDLDDQEVGAIDGTFPKADVVDILQRISYSSSFLEAAMEAAAAKNATKAYWALAQFDFAYKPEKARRPIADDPLFLGVFDWNDSEDDE
jgi:hypothetical protein